MIISKKTLKWLIPAAAALLIAVFIGFKVYKSRKEALPHGIASGNGRIEATLVDVAANEPLKVKEVLAKEGDLVRVGQIVVKLDTVTLDAELAEANAGVAAAEERSARRARRS